MQRSKGHLEFIDRFEYYKLDDRLFCAEAKTPVVKGRRPGKFVTSGAGIEFALRLARLAPGESRLSKRAK